MSRETIFRYSTEAAMCAAFVEYAQGKGWLVYPETCGFDMVLVRQTDGAQLAVEAKQQLNVHVLTQVVTGAGRWQQDSGPDYRAVLVPVGGTAGLEELARVCGITVIRAMRPGSYVPPWRPELRVDRRTRRC